MSERAAETVVDEDIDEKLLIRCFRWIVEAASFDSGLTGAELFESVFFDHGTDIENSVAAERLLFVALKAACRMGYLTVKGRRSLTGPLETIPKDEIAYLEFGISGCGCGCSCVYTSEQPCAVQEKRGASGKGPRAFPGGELVHPASVIQFISKVPRWLRYPLLKWPRYRVLRWVRYPALYWVLYLYRRHSWGVWRDLLFFQGERKLVDEGAATLAEAIKRAAQKLGGWPGRDRNGPSWKSFNDAVWVAAGVEPEADGYSPRQIRRVATSLAIAEKKAAASKG